MGISVNFLRNAGVLAIAVAAAYSAPALANTVITGARMLDVLTGKMVENPAIFVDDSGRITSIADARTVKWGSARRTASPCTTCTGNTAPWCMSIRARQERRHHRQNSSPTAH